MRRLSRIVGGILCFFLLRPAFADYAFITQAEVLLSDADEPPVSALDWRDVSLPRSWSVDPLHPKDTRVAWYRIPVPANRQEKQWDHLLLLRHMMNVEIWLDQQFIGSGGPVSNPVTARLQRNWNRPILLRIPEFPPGTEHAYFYVRLISEPAYGVMTPVILGTRDSLLPWYRISTFVQITLVKLSLLALAFTALLSLFVWRDTRQRHWLLLTAMSITWAMPLLFIVLPTLPMHEFIALRLIHWGVVAGAVSLLAFVYSVTLNAQDPRLRLLPIIPVLHGLLVAVVPNNQVVNVGNAGQFFCQLLFVALIVVLVRSPQRTSRAVWSIVAGLVIMLLSALHDVTLFAGSNTERWRWDTPISYVTQPLMLLTVAVHGVRNFLGAAKALSAANDHLHMRLQENERRIRQLFQAQESAERTLRLAAERELVYRDVHDDLGARLLSLVYQSDKGRAQDLARSALQDLRDIVSRVLAKEQGLAAVVADCLAEQMQRAEVLGASLEWEMSPRVETCGCGSREMLNLRLLLRELIGACLHTPGLMQMRIDADWEEEAQCLVLRVHFVDGGKEHTESEHAAHETLARLPLVRKRLQAMQAFLLPHAEGFELRVPVPQQLPQWQASPLG